MGVNSFYPAYAGASQDYFEQAQGRSFIEMDITTIVNQAYS